MSQRHDTHDLTFSAWQLAAFLTLITLPGTLSSPCQPSVTPLVLLVSVLMSLTQENCLHSPRLHMPHGTVCLSFISFVTICNTFVFGIISVLPIFSPLITSSIKGNFYVVVHHFILDAYGVPGQCKYFVNTIFFSK